MRLARTDADPITYTAFGLWHSLLILKLSCLLLLEAPIVSSVALAVACAPALGPSSPPALLGSPENRFRNNSHFTSCKNSWLTSQVVHIGIGQKTVPGIGAKSFLGVYGIQYIHG